ncbi:uncharacterized protein LOC122940579 [Bufo gargarizans]|uniref:uncharacterized protein LOC122940579 n=1 Tax=Bufo gargarizans TaxID=30331 RepID=UPI001CF58286|nr:uncharacterized protein LOC122940579 [Bufo gargarizans]
MARLIRHSYSIGSSFYTPWRVPIIRIRQRLQHQPTSHSVFFRAKTPKRKNTRRAGRHYRGAASTNGNEIPGINETLLFNISSKNLTPTQLKLLQKGLSFSPIEPFDSFQFDMDCRRFFRSIRLKAHFATKDMSVSTSSIPTQIGLNLNQFGLRLKSNFQPPKIHHPAETYISLVQRDFDAIISDFRREGLAIAQNLSKEERNALYTILDDKSVIFKPADKGGSLVMLDKEYYVSEILSQLSDHDTYHPLDRDPVFDIKRKLSEIVNRHKEKGLIDDKLGQFLINQHPVTPVLYTLPKIHKCLTAPPGRPIVASNDSILSAPAMLLEKVLTPLIKKTPSFLLDTTHFLSEIRKVHLESGDLLVTYDVRSLYTSIEHVKGLTAVEWVLEFSDHSAEEKMFFLQLLQLVLE